MAEFKVNDIVIWRSDEGRTIGTVTQVSSSDFQAKVDWNILNPYGYSHRNVSQNGLELFKFQIGDKVRIKNREIWRLWSGIYTISEFCPPCTDSDGRIRTWVHFKEQAGGFEPSELELVKEDNMSEIDKLSKQLAEAQETVKRLQAQLEKEDKALEIQRECEKGETNGIYLYDRKGSYNSKETWIVFRSRNDGKNHMSLNLTDTGLGYQNFPAYNFSNFRKLTKAQNKKVYEFIINLEKEND